jgi:membrane protease YdiL (CAAX protease family)
VPKPRRGARHWTTAAAISVVLVALAAGATRVVRLERAELELHGAPVSLHELMSKPHATRISVRVAQVVLRAGQHSIFELCAADGLPEARWLGALEFAVLHLEAKQLMLRVPFDAAHLEHVRRNRQGGCLLLGSGLIEHNGTYSVEAVWSQRPPPAAVLEVPIQLRVLAKAPLDVRDRLCVLVLGLGVLGLLVAAMRSARSAQQPLWANTHGPFATRAAFALLAMTMLYALSQLPSPGSSFTLGKGVLLLALQAGLAYQFASRFAPGDTRRALGLVAPLHMRTALSSGLLAWPLLVTTARLALHWVPSSGESPIQSFIAWPSGMLAAALLGVLLPAAEELFFRGYLYAALLPLGRAAAAGVSVALFGLMHAQQSWGNWGGLAAVFAAGAVFCALRLISGSTLISALTHVAYNLTLSLASIASSE